MDVETIRYYEDRLASGAGACAQRPIAATHRLISSDWASSAIAALDIPLADIARLLEFVQDPSAECREIDQLIDTQLARCAPASPACRRSNSSW